MTKLSSDAIVLKSKGNIALSHQEIVDTDYYYVTIGFEVMKEFSSTDTQAYKDALKYYEELTNGTN